MEIRILRYFSVIAELESFSRAAEILHVSQPALSRQIQDLEEELHTSLFERKNRRITLTEDGRKLQKRARDILQLVDKTETEFLHPENEISGDIYIASGEAEVFHTIASAITAMHEKYPSVVFHLYTRTAYETDEELESGLLDFGVVIDTFNVQKYNRLNLPCLDSWGLLMRKDSPLSLKSCITAEDLADLPLIYSISLPKRNDLTGWLKKGISELQQIATCDMSYNASFLVEQGMCCALTFTEMNNYNSELLCTRPLYPPVPVNMTLIWRKHVPLSSAAKAFVSILQDEINRNV